MYPAFACTDSYPYHINPMFYPSRAKDTDPRTLNSPCQTWPYGGNYYYPAPPEYHHGGCHHNYLAGPYTFQPPYPHYPLPSPPPRYTYPPFPVTHPAYCVPPPLYSVEPPQYDYDKKTDHTPHRCCGCTHQEADKTSRIEPEGEKKTNDTMAVKDHPYPNMWIPPGYMKNTEPEMKHNPVSLKLREPSKQGGNNETGHDQQCGDGYRFPFPIIWLPSHINEAGKDNLDRATCDGLNFYANDDKKRGTVENEGESEMKNTHGVQKVIPVKQMGTEEKNNNLKVIEAKTEKTEGKTSSKTSKLPPVCLRIDPLPKKKSSSRSPSPPINKQRSCEIPTEIHESTQQETQLLEHVKNTNEEQTKSNTITSEIETKEVEKKKLSEHEAAVIIQSLYRGFEVRKSKPLTKLKQIAEVKKQVVELRSLIQDLESSTSGIDNKQKLVTGETIMNLLLKLDTIQGLHPIVRDIRKSVAKELVGLQEKLDSLMFLHSETSSENTISITKTDGMSIMNPNPEDKKPDQADSNGNREVDATESQYDGSSEAHDTKPEPQVEWHDLQGTNKPKPQPQPQVELCDQKSTNKPEPDPKPEPKPQVELRDQQSTNEPEPKPQMELHDQQGSNEPEPEPEPEPQVELYQQGSNEPGPDQDQEKSDHAQVELLDQQSTNKRKPKPEPEPQVELLDQQSTNKPRPDQEKFDYAQAPPKHCEMEATGFQDDGDAQALDMSINDLVETKLNLEKHTEFLSGGDRKVVEENERLRGMVEELMKVGNEQLGVITELTGRVKDLERKLSGKKKKKMKSRKSRARSCVVQEELKEVHGV